VANATWPALEEIFLSMNGLYHPRGFWRGLIRQPAWHLREWMCTPAYRALHRFHRQLNNWPRFTRAQVRFAQNPIHICDGPSFLSAWDEIFINRIYDIPTASSERPTLVDAGANIGLAALYWKLRFGSFEYLGFEPDPDVAACCRENLRAWGIKGELIEAALGKSERLARFSRDRADGGRLVSGGEALKDGLTVEVKRLAPLLPEKVDLLKIDVEGAEAEVLEDIAPCLNRVRLLFVEWHSRSGRPGLGVAIDRLESAGYDCYVQVASGPPRPFLARPTGTSFSQHLNLYAVRR
jgi:FkbM family methyltransferase